MSVLLCYNVKVECVIVGFGGGGQTAARLSWPAGLVLHSAWLKPLRLSSLQ